MKKSKERRKKKCLMNQAVDPKTLADKITQQMGDQFILTPEDINIREGDQEEDSKTDLHSSKFSDLTSSQSNAPNYFAEEINFNEES